MDNDEVLLQGCSVCGRKIKIVRQRIFTKLFCGHCGAVIEVEKKRLAAVTHPCDLDCVTSDYLSRVGSQSFVDARAMAGNVASPYQSQSVSWDRRTDGNGDRGSRDLIA